MKFKTKEKYNDNNSVKDGMRDYSTGDVLFPTSPNITHTLFPDHDCRDFGVWNTSETVCCDRCGEEYQRTELGYAAWHDVFNWKECECYYCSEFDGSEIGPFNEVVYP